MTSPPLGETNQHITQLKESNERVNGLEELLRANTVSVEALKKTREFLFNEVKDVKDDMKHVKNDLKMVHEISDVHGKKMSEIDSRLNDVERYKRRWHLRLYTAVKPAAVQKNTVKPAAIEINVRVYYNDYGNHRNNTEETRF